LRIIVDTPLDASTPLTLFCASYATIERQSGDLERMNYTPMARSRPEGRWMAQGIAAARSRRHNRKQA